MVWFLQASDPEASSQWQSRSKCIRLQKAFLCFFLCFLGSFAAILETLQLTIWDRKFLELSQELRNDFRSVCFTPGLNPVLSNL